MSKPFVCRFAKVMALLVFCFLNLPLVEFYVTAETISPQLPAAVSINEDAGRGNLLFVTLRMEDGEELPFFVDTGSTFTSLDKSLESKLEKRVEGATLSGWGVTARVAGYTAPKLYIGNTPLLTGSRIYIGDFRNLSSQTCRPVMGVLGMDCLRHYCIQIDFATGKLRFLDSDHMDASRLGKAYPLTFRSGCPFICQGNLISDDGTNLLVDTGYRGDGAIESRLFQWQVQKLRSDGREIWGQHAGRIWFSESIWSGGSYTNLLIGDGGTNFSKGEGGNEIGLRFLARHLLTLDFPNHIMYLKQNSIGPLVDEKMQSSEEFLNDLKAKNRLPGWAMNDDETFFLEAYPDFEAFDTQRKSDLTILHYQVARPSENGQWELKKAWRTEQGGQTIEKYAVP
jgi:Aspartyl protease